MYRYSAIGVWPQIFKKWAKPYLKIFSRKSLNFRTKIEDIGKTRNLAKFRGLFKIVIGGIICNFTPILPYFQHWGDEPRPQFCSGSEIQRRPKKMQMGHFFPKFR